MFFVFGIFSERFVIIAPAADEFLEVLRVQNSEGTAHYRCFHALNPLKKYFGKTRADKIKSRDVEKYVAWRREQKSVKTGKPITADTVNKELTTLSRVYRRLIKNNLVGNNPASEVSRLPANVPTFHVITPEQEKIYLMACPPMLQDVATVMLETGMRCGEVYRIRRDGFFPERNYVQITKGKTKAARRRVYLTQKAKTVLLRRADRFEGENLFPQNDRDFAPPTDTLDKTHREVIRTLKYDFRLYDCRHTFCTRAVESGIDLITLAAIVGHTNLKMLTRYCHPSEANKHNAILRMEKLAKAV